VPGFDSAQLIGLFRELAGFGALCLVHSEDDAMLADNERALRAAGRMDPSVIPEWRTREAELTALNMVGLFARLTGVRAIAAHVSHPDAVELLQQERALGAHLSIETCPQYMYLLEDEILEHGALRKFTPPARARSRSDSDAMWRLVSSGPVTHISTDHAPATRAQKTDGSIWDAHFGLPGVETTYGLLLNAALDGRLSLERVVELVAESPARLYGLTPRKGRLEPGADADLVLVDLRGERTLEDASVVSKAGWTPYAGWRLKGRIVKTFSRGQLVGQEGKPATNPGAGQFLAGPGASS
jgi:dihydroorotase-like cyclic amidohydrolase